MTEKKTGQTPAEPVFDLSFFMDKLQDLALSLFLPAAPATSSAAAATAATSPG